MAIAIFFTGHWFSSLFSQTFFLHRYSAHHMFEMNKFWERFFHIFTFISQGSTYLNARAYAILHRLHHAHSDTKTDHHSPVFYKSVFGMMWRTKKIYSDLVNDRIKVKEKLGSFSNLNRKSIFMTQTPQGFNYRDIFILHKKNII